MISGERQWYSEKMKIALYANGVNVQQFRKKNLIRQLRNVSESNYRTN